MHERHGTRIRCEIPFTLTSLDLAQPFCEPCVAILANPHGCAARSNRSLEVGTAVELEGLPANGRIRAQVVNCVSLGQHEQVRILGLAFDEPGNVWGIESPPDDWTPKSMRAVPGALILCIEDDPTYLALRKNVLEGEGYEIVSAATGDEALKALRDFPICAIITDHKLRGRTGTHLAREMKRLKPHVPIVLFSGTIAPHLDDVDVYINKGEPAAKFLGIVRAIVKRFRSQMAQNTRMPLAYREPMVRELTPEETKLMLADFASRGDCEAQKLLENFLAAHPKSTY